MKVDADAVLAGDRIAVARAITLVESSRPDHRAAAVRLLSTLLPHTGQAYRVGVTGVPGAGKSTFVDALGGRLVATGHRVAVLAVDPSSSRSQGSILGDRTRMGQLAAHPAAFVRPSPSAGTLGGVARATREAMVVVEAAGYDAVLVETVGVGQSEAAVAAMVDSVLLLTVAGTGDELQGVKRGVLEHADVVAVTKADGPNEAPARRAARELRGALRLSGRDAVPVLACSAHEGTGVEEVWAALRRDHDGRAGNGELAERRRRQRLDWVWSLVRARVLDELHAHPSVPDVERRVAAGTLLPSRAADLIVDAFLGR
ncbi:methylmalonyl Co-A mutase-associated GTPase MeaB [Micromonospora sp. CPCC 206061]|uniref:methylmalonyl Co-A mutase-associated GTPase MeaB n=1 Tax=Micromonospora sp. CPCC 206061 TaxID=3122410 RepID=UPI002FF1B8D1